MLVGVRTLVDPNDPTDAEKVHALQDGLKVEQPGGPGKFEVPKWDPVSQKKVRDALIVLGTTLTDTSRSFGTKDQVEPIQRLISAATTWGGNPRKDAIYLNFTPPKNDGNTIYKLNVKDVPVDGFWSVSLYNKEGYYEKNPYNAYSLNNITSKKNADGSVTIQFGGCDGKMPELPADHEWLELHRAALSAARRNPERQVEIPGTATGQLRTYHERPRYLRLDRPHHPGRQRDRRVLHRRLAAGSHRQNPRPSTRAGRDGRWLGHIDLRLCAVAGRAGLGLCRCARRASEGAAAMMIALMAVYLVLLFVLVRFGIVAFNLFWKCSPFIVLLLLNFLLFIPMGWGAPQGSALVVRNAVSIIPNVAGEVIDVPVEGNAALKTGDVLFRIDPVPYEAQVRAIEAQLKFSATRLAQMTQLFERDSGRGFDVEQRQSEVDQLKAQLEGAKWNLDKTVVRAPADGYATNVALRKGARVARFAVMAFIDTSETVIGVEISQNDARYIAPGQSVELTFKLMPGTVYTGKVETVLQAISTGQTQASGLAVTPKAVESAPFVVRVKLDDQELSKRLPAGSTGTAAIFTEAVKPTHIIRKVLLRQIAILNYVNPF